MSRKKPATRTREPAQQSAAPAGVLTREEAAAYLKISVKHLAKLVRERAIAECDLGHITKRYRVGDLDAFLVARRTPAKEAA